MRNLTLKNLNYLFLFHGLSLDLRKKWGGGGCHRTNYLSGGPNLTLPPQNSKIIQYKTLRSDFFVIYKSITCMKQFSIITLKRRKRKHCIIDAHLGIDPGPLVPKSATLTIRRARLQITVHIGQIIRVPAITG